MPEIQVTRGYSNSFAMIEHLELLTICTVPYIQYIVSLKNVDGNGASFPPPLSIDLLKLKAICRFDILLFLHRL